MDYVFFAKVDEICTTNRVTILNRKSKVTKDRVICTNTNHRILMDSKSFNAHPVAVNEYRFFGVTKNSRGEILYRCSTLMDASSVTETDQSFINLANAVNRMSEDLEKLCETDRKELLTKLGIGLAAAGTIGSAVTAITAAMATVPEPTTILCSGALSVTLGAITALQLESLSVMQKAAAQSLENYQKSLDKYRLMVNTYCPFDRSYYEFLDPRVNSLVTRIKVAMRNKQEFSLWDLMWTNEVQFA